MDADLVVLPLRLGPFWNFVYLVGSRAAGEAVVVDPAWDVPAIRDIAAKARLRISAAAVTHAHHDHAHGLDGLVRATGVPVLVHHRDAGELRTVYDGPLSPVEDGEEYHLGRLRLRFLHTPGHTPGSQCLLAGGALFTGDTLMVGALGRPGSQAGAVKAMWRSVSEVFACLPDGLVLYPGHDYGRRQVSTLGDERRVNPCLLPRSYEEFARCIARGRT